MTAKLLIIEKQIPLPPSDVYRHSCRSAGFRELMHGKKYLIGSLLLISLGFFFCMTLLAGFARPLMTTKLIGSLNIGFALIILAYLVCWSAALLYVWAANEVFDQQVASIVTAGSKRSKQP